MENAMSLNLIVIVAVLFVIGMAVWWLWYPLKALAQLPHFTEMYTIRDLLTQATEDVLCHGRSGRLSEFKEGADRLMESLKITRKMIESDRWCVIGIQVPGYKNPDDERADEPVYAPAEFNWHTGELRAPRQGRVLTQSRDVLCGHVKGNVAITALCAPRYQRVTDDQKTIILLGESYCWNG